PTAILDAVGDRIYSGSPQSQLIKQGRQTAEKLEAPAPDKVKATLMALLCRVAVHPDHIEINVSRQRLAELLSGQTIHLTMQDQSLGRKSNDVVTLTVPARLKRVGREMRMLVENADHEMVAAPSFLRLIARAHDIQRRLSQNTKLTVHDIAREERVTAAYLYT